jgi:hypothetical protein
VPSTAAAVLLEVGKVIESGVKMEIAEGAMTGRSSMENVIICGQNGKRSSAGGRKVLCNKYALNLSLYATYQGRWTKAVE